MPLFVIDCMHEFSFNEENVALDVKYSVCFLQLYAGIFYCMSIILSRRVRYDESESVLNELSEHHLKPLSLNFIDHFKRDRYVYSTIPYKIKSIRTFIVS